MDKLDEVLVGKSRILSSASVSEKSNFIESYFMKAYEKNKNYLNGDDEMSKKLKSRLRGEL